MAYSNKSNAELAELVRTGKASDWEYREYQRRMSVDGKHRADMNKSMLDSAKKDSVASGFLSGLFGGKK